MGWSASQTGRLNGTLFAIARARHLVSRFEVPFLSPRSIAPGNEGNKGHALSINAFVAALTSPSYCLSIATTSSLGWPVIAASVLTSLCLAILRVCFFFCRCATMRLYRRSITSRTSRPNPSSTEASLEQPNRRMLVTDPIP